MSVRVPNSEEDPSLKGTSSLEACTLPSESEMMAASLDPEKRQHRRSQH